MGTKSNVLDYSGSNRRKDGSYDEASRVPDPNDYPDHRRMDRPHLRDIYFLAEGGVAGRLRTLLRAPGAGRSQPVGNDDISSRLRQALAKVDVGLDDAEGEVAGGIRRQSICREIPGPMVEGEALAAVGRPRPDAQVLVVVAIPLRPIDAVHPDQPVLRIVTHMHIRQQNDVAVGVVIGAVVQHPVGHWVVPRLVRVAQTLGHVLAGPVAKVVVLVDTFRLGKITI